MSQTRLPHSAGVKQVCCLLLLIVFISSGAFSQTTIFTSQTPTVGTDNDHKPTGGQEVGVKFTSSAAGTITGIRFYKTSGNTGTHIGELYESNGTRLAQATFVNETATGWQTVSFSSPVTITANTSYTAAYFSSLGNYTEQNDYFKGHAVTNASLTAPADGTNGGNGTDPGNGQGVYAYSATPTFPNQLYKSANYWVDVIFNNASTVVANAGPDQTYPYPIGSITLNGSTSTGNITSYLWTLVSGPNVPVFDAPTSVTTSVSGLTDGVYIFNLSVNGGASSAKVTITRKTPPPTVYIGANAAIVAPISTIELGSVQDPGIMGGTVSSVSWSKVSGPSNPIFTRSGGTRVDISGLIQGVYILQLKETGPGGSDSARVTVTVLPPGLSPNIFTTQVPLVGNTNAGQGIEVGVKFRSSVPGYITGIRFYKSSGNSGTHTGELYSSDGKRLAQAVFTNETASGWQTVTFSSPVAILDYVTYVAAYYSSAGNYTGTPNYFTDNVTNNPLSVPSDINDPPNGVYKKTSTPSFPSSSDGNKENYWVDVVFSNGTSSVKADAGTNQMIVSSTTSVSGANSTGTITSYLWTMISGPYNVTPVITTPTSVSTTITGLKPASGPFGDDEGYYQFQLSVNGGASVSRITIHVSAISVNLSYPQTVTYPNSSATFDATGTTGINNTYLWTQYSGPNKPTITSPNAVSTTVTGLSLGNYTFFLSVNGNNYYSFDVSVVPEVDSIFTSQIPAQTTNNNGKSIEVGMKFRSSKSGFINGMRFYKANGNIGTHIGELYSSTGTLLAHATFTNETANGWQSVSFAPSVAITANTTYTVSYFSNSGYYSTTPNYFTTGVTNGALTALADGTDGSNGAFIYSNTPAFPTGNAGNKPNYWIDPIFSNISNAPVASAGDNQVINLPTQSTILYGSGSTGIITSYLWTQVSGPTNAVINDPTNVTAFPDGLVQGVYVFKLSVNGGASTSLVTVEVDGALPAVANAGPNQTIYLPNTTLTLDGSGSTGNITNYKWKQISGDNALPIANPFNSKTTVSGLVPGVYNFTLAINDGASVSQVTITVNPAPPPIANAGTTQTITLPVSSASLNGSGSTGAITGYTWSEISGPNTAQFSSLNEVSPTVSGLVQGLYVFQLSLKDGTTPAQVTVNVLAGSNTGKNIFTTQVPVSKTDNDHQSSVGFEAGLKFRSSLAGSITGIRFYKTTGNTGTHTGELYSSAGTRLAQATFTSETATGWQTVTFSSPVAIAANTTYVAAYFSSLGNYVVDNGYFAAPVVNAPLTALADGTDGGNAPFKYASTPSFPNQNYMKANYWVDVVFVSGSTAIANAGFNQTINLPTSTITLNGSSSTGATSYKWTTVSGPNVPVIATPTTVSTTVSGLVQGTYVFSLSINGGASTAQVSVIVNAPLPPVANAGVNQTITLPAQLVLNAGGSTGVINSYTWTEISGPNAATITSPNNSSTSIKDIVAGTYVFQISLNGGISTARVTITVNPGAFPNANAGPSQAITLPVTTVTLDGSGSNGYITDYTWTVIYTPNGAPAPVITSPYTATTTVTGLVVGDYLFGLSLNGGMSQSSVLVEVTASTPPIANAGTDQTITLPVTSINLDGSGSTGSITNYQWSWTHYSSFGNAPDITNANSVSAIASGLSVGTYTFQLALNGSQLSVASVNVTVNPPASPGTIFTTQIPAAPTENDHQPTIGQEVGVKFTASTNGFVDGIRFYKTVGNTGTHIGELYSSTGVRIASATFVNETDAGWQVVYFNTPVQVNANTTYTAAYFSSEGNYTEDNDYFLHHSVTNGAITAPADGTNGLSGTDPGTGQGVYKYTSSPSFPNQLYRSANYWVDVTFSPAISVTSSPVIETAKAVEAVADSVVKQSYFLGQNYPNPVPMSQTTKIEYSVPVSTQVSLILYDMQGKPVKILVNETKNAGRYEYDLNTGTLAKGLYIYSMHAGSFYDVKKLVVQ